ncbi:MAG TPA: site-2 protease family protein [Polyangiaceae bacterium]|nr:site-2 protease family protein [Polyangiaceae bacterium]
MAPAEPARAPVSRTGWHINVWLFLATVASAFVTQLNLEPSAVHAAQYTAALMAILLAHEFGHFIAARLHRVDASLPYFIPLPFVSLFGTMGAVIRMRSVIPTRRALLDIGASGPLAGMALAIPLYAWGVAHSQVVPVEADGVQLGSSLLSRLLEIGFGPPVPNGYYINLSPVAFAGWVGMFVTMVNLLPLSQLDGGHVAYALFGPRHNAIAQWVHRSMLAFFFVSLGGFTARDLRAGVGPWHFGYHVNNSLIWLVLFEGLAILGTFSAPGAAATDRLGVRTRAFAVLGLALLAFAFRDRPSGVLWGAWFVGLGVLMAMEIGWGALRSTSALVDHPATGPAPLRPGRAAVAVVTLVLFALLFMPTPIML